jgi:hypothetical protein
MPVVATTLTGVREACDALGERLDSEVRNALSEIAFDVAGSAKALHGFSNRTGRLERSIRPNPTRGSLRNGTLSVEVVASAPYGIYVDEGMEGRYAFLLPAFERREHVAYEILEEAIEDAVHGAGWE